MTLITAELHSGWQVQLDGDKSHNASCRSARRRQTPEVGDTRAVPCQGDCRKRLTWGEPRKARAPHLETEEPFWVGFDLYSPALGEYTYRLFEVTYPPQFFPVTLTAADGVQTAQTLDQLKTILELVLRSPRTKQVVEAIMAQATALGAVEASK
jgi:hypothetical protein